MFHHSYDMHAQGQAVLRVGYRHPYLGFLRALASDDCLAVVTTSTIAHAAAAWFSGRTEPIADLLRTAQASLLRHPWQRQRPVANFFRRALDETEVLVAVANTVIVARHIITGRYVGDVMDHISASTRLLNDHPLPIALRVAAKHHPHDEELYDTAISELERHNGAPARRLITFLVNRPTNSAPERRFIQSVEASIDDYRQLSSLTAAFRDCSPLAA
jgi:hypothetical protein